MAFQRGVGRKICESEEEKMQNIEKLLKLIKENPELPIIPMVSNDVCSDDSGYWEGEWGSAYVDEFLYCPLRNYIAFKNDDDVYDTLERYLRPDEFERLPESEDECREIYNQLPWKKAIIVNIEAIVKED